MKTNRIIILTLMIFFIPGIGNSQSHTPLRRPISPEQPMWLIHIDTWNYPDPQKIIELVPKDIRPYVVMNIALSINHDTETGRFRIAEYGYEVAKSWLRTCAENRMWAMVQPSSGAYSQLPDDDLSVYEQLYQDYPNLIGFNYCEQSWGYGDDDPLATSWSDRIAHFANLLELNDQYGGYLVVSWCGNRWSPNINPIAMAKRNPDFASACSNYTKNYILCEKYTFKTYQSDMESVCLGSYLSGFSGQYGIRYDDTGWSDKDGNPNENFTMATYGAPFLEHIMLTGQTVVDGPELIWRYCFTEIAPGSTSNGYTMRRWETFPQFDNVSVDLFRKVLDGTVRIPSRQEVIDRTKVVIINDINTGSIDDMYSSPETLFEGLYRMDGDGNYEENMSFFKKTGRYPTLPTVYQLDDEPANTFQVKLNKSAYSIRWPSITSKVDEFNNRFPEEYTGDLYAGRHENGWVTYNPYKTGQTASANIPFKYNTCDHMELSYSQYTAGVIKEYADYLTIYLSNYDNMLYAGPKTNTIKIYGSSSEPTCEIEERADDQQSKITKDWSGGIFTLKIEHNGPIDIKVNCSGTATGRLTDYQAANIAVPARPPVYTGPIQYEAETFDYKNIIGYVKNGYSGNIRNYTGQGYLQFGTNSAASVRDNVTVLNEGSYTLKTKYTVSGGNVNTIDLYINGSGVATPSFTQTSSLSDWAVDSQTVELKKGVNIIEYKANAAGAHTIYFDNLVLESSNSDNIWLEAECGIVGSLWETKDDTDASNDSYVTIQSGSNSTGTAPDNSDGHITYDFNISESGTFTAWGRVIAPTEEDNAFWVKMDYETWMGWELPLTTSWTWVEINSFSLDAGNHVLGIAYNEDGTFLDKIFITRSDSIPSGIGGPAINCTTGNQYPIAYSGPDKTLIDRDDNGTETIALNSTGSIDPDGFIDSYIWSEGVNVIASGENPSVVLSVGVHVLTLTVTDNEGAADSSTLIITIHDSSFEFSEIWLEPECAIVGVNWDTIADVNASNGYYVMVKPGIESLNQAPASDDGLVNISFNIVAQDNYAVYGRLNCPSYDDDSFWLKMDNGGFSYYNGLVTNGWEWIKFSDYSLSEGEHTLSVGYREDGAKLDKICITKNADEPTGLGYEATNCESDNDTTTMVNLNENNNSTALGQNNPNPFNVSTLIKYTLSNPGHAVVKIFDIRGQKIETIVNKYQSAGQHEVIWHPDGLSGGLYFYQLQTGSFSETKKLVFQKK